MHTAVRLYTMAGVFAGSADCTLVLEPRRFARSAWHGTLTNLQPAPLAAGRYLMQVPNGRAAEVELSAVDFAGCAFEGIGPSPVG